MVGFFIAAGLLLKRHLIVLVWMPSYRSAGTIQA
jgi:hypothetical protein